MKYLKRTTVLVLSLLLLATFSWAFFQPTFFRVHDFTHVARLIEMKRALDAGHVPAIWAQNLGFGYGMPLFLFYGPVPSYLGVLLATIGINAVWSVKLVFAFTGVLSFTGMYFFLQRWGRAAAVTGAALLLAAPYRAVDLFVRGALNEVFAIGILPWILHGLWLIGEKPRRGFLTTAFWTSLLVMTHNLTAFIALPFLFLLGGFRLLQLPPAKRWRSLALTAAAGITGILLSAFYAVPAFLEKDQTVIGEILSGYFDFRLHFLYIRQLIWPNWGFGGSEFGPNDGISFHLGFPLILLVGLAWLLLALRLFLSWRKHRHLKLLEKDWLTVTFTLAAAGALFFTLTHSQSIWEAVPLLSFVQFPWRFMGVAIVLFAVVAGIGVSRVKGSWLRWNVVGLALLAVLFGQLQFHQPEAFLDTDEGYYYEDEQRLRTQMSEILPDYIPAGFDRSLPPVGPEKRIIVEPEAEVLWELNRPHELLLFTDVKTGTVTWNIADFPGWEYFVNDTLVEPEKLPDGRRQYSSEESVKSVGARFGLTPLRRWTLLISVAAWIGLAALALPERKMHHE